MIELISSARSTRPIGLATRALAAYLARAINYANTRTRRWPVDENAHKVQSRQENSRIKKCILTHTLTSVSSVTTLRTRQGCRRWRWRKFQDERRERKSRNRRSLFSFFFFFWVISRIASAKVHYYLINYGGWYAIKTSIPGSAFKSRGSHQNHWMTKTKKKMYTNVCINSIRNPAFRGCRVY